MKEKGSAWRLATPCVAFAISLFLLFGPPNQRVPYIRILYAFIAAVAVVFFLYEWSEIKKIRRARSEEEKPDDHQEM